MQLFAQYRYQDGDEDQLAAANDVEETATTTNQSAMSFQSAPHCVAC